MDQRHNHSPARRSLRSGFVSAGFLLLGLSGVAEAAPLLFHATPLLQPPDTTGAYVIQGDTVAVGGAVAGSAVRDSDGATVAVRWQSNGAPTLLQEYATSTETFVGSFASGMNRHGDAVGAVSLFSTDTGLTFDHAVRWSPAGVAEPLPAVPNLVGNSAASSVNNIGQAAGYAELAAGGRAVRWSGASAVVLSDPDNSTTGSVGLNLNDAGQVAGYDEIFTGATRAVRWDSDGSGHVLGGIVSVPGSAQANGINGSGATVGRILGPAGSRAVAWDANGNATLLADPAGDPTLLTEAYSIDDAGHVVGFGIFADDFSSHAMFWNPDHTGVRLEDLLDATGWTLYSAQSIDTADGTMNIVVSGMNPEGDVGFYLLTAEVPEPAGVSLLLASGLLLVRGRRRRS